VSSLTQTSAFSSAVDFSAQTDRKKDLFNKSLKQKQQNKISPVGGRHKDDATTVCPDDEH